MTTYLTISLCVTVCTPNGGRACPHDVVITHADRHCLTEFHDDWSIHLEVGPSRFLRWHAVTVILDFVKRNFYHFVECKMPLDKFLNKFNGVTSSRVEVRANCRFSRWRLLISQNSFPDPLYIQHAFRHILIF
jgi:hypothetical protein